MCILVVRPFLWYQGQDDLSMLMSNIKVTLEKKNEMNGRFGTLLFYKHILFKDSFSNLLPLTLITREVGFWYIQTL